VEAVDTGTPGPHPMIFTVKLCMPSFNPETTIRVSIPEREKITLAVDDAS